jgi:hypothetical protein
MGSRSESNKPAIVRKDDEGRRESCAESRGHDPEPGDLGVGRPKRNESCVEGR